MNLYLVVSETLETVVCEDSSVNACHIEPYHIVELVVARSRGQARYLAWKSDKDSFSHDICEIPKFRVELKWHFVDGPSRIASSEHDSDELWTFSRGATQVAMCGEGGGVSYVS